MPTPRIPLRYYSADVSEDKRFLYLSISEGTHGSELHFRDLSKANDPFHLLCPGFEFDYAPVDNIGDTFLVHTNCDAPNFRVVAIDAATPGKENWRTVIPEKPEVLLGVGTAGGKLFCEYLKDVTSRVSQHDLAGKLEREIALPGLGSAGGFGGKKEDKILFYTFTSFNYPPVIFQYDIASGESTALPQERGQVQPRRLRGQAGVLPEQGRHPRPHVHRPQEGAGAATAAIPTLLYAYGGFNISMTPWFSAGNLVVPGKRAASTRVANLRGGGEYGEAWHRAGMLEKKQNVFDDFIAAAEYLVQREVHPPRQTGHLRRLQRRPAGGRLHDPAPRAVQGRPARRWASWTCCASTSSPIGWDWAVEYGSSDDPSSSSTCYAYSPLHNLKPGVSYPATLVTTADHDDRVVPAHSFKFIATLQERQQGDEPGADPHRDPLRPRLVQPAQGHRDGGGHLGRSSSRTWAWSANK